MENNINDDEFIDVNSYEVRLEKYQKTLNLLTKPIVAGLLQGFWDSFYYNGICMDKIYKWSVIGKDTLFF